MVTKDRDFRDGHLLSGSPGRRHRKHHTELLSQFRANLATIIDAIGEADFVELGPRTGDSSAT